MKTIALALVASAALVTAAPAQPPGPMGFWNNTPQDPIQRLQILRDRIDQSASRGRISPQEADRARTDVSNAWNWIHRMHWRARGHLSPNQEAQVQQRIDQIVHEVRWDQRSWQ